MKKKTVIGTFLFVLLVLQAQAVFADYNEDFAKELQRNNISNIEKLLQRRAGQMDLSLCLITLFRSWGGGEYSLNNNYRNNTLAVTELLVRYGVDLNRSVRHYYFNGYRNRPQLSSYSSDPYYPLHYAISSKVDLSVIRYLLENGANPNQTGQLALDSAVIRKDQNLISLLLTYGAKASKEGFFSAIRNNDFNLARILLENGADINARESWGSREEWDRGMPHIKNGTILMNSADSGRFDAVKFLVENNARINLRDDNGSTAASLAYDAGEIEIYNYLKEHGAIDYEPRQVAQPAAPAVPPSTTNVYVQPSAPVQPAPPPTPSTPTLRPGRYACSGTNVTMEIQSPLRFVTLYSGYTTVGNGSYNINGNTITITIAQASDEIKHMRGITYAYTIVSDTSFSGSGETWYRR